MKPRAGLAKCCAQLPAHFAHPLKDYEAQYGDPAQFLDYAYRSLQLATIPF